MATCFIYNISQELLLIYSFSVICYLLLFVTLHSQIKERVFMNLQKHDLIKFLYPIH
jgi:hypothetical protein